MTAINPVGNEQKTSPILPTLGAAAVGGAAGYGAKYFQKVDMTSKDVVDFAKNAKAEDKNKLAAALDAIKEKLFPSKKGTTPIEFDKLDATEKETLKSVGIETSEAATAKAIAEKSTTLGQEAKALTGDFAEITDDTAKKLKENYGKIKSAIEGNDIKALQNVDNDEVKTLGKILEEADIKNYTDEQKTLLRKFGVALEGEGAVQNADGVKTALKKFDFGTYVDNMQKEGQTIRGMVETQAKKVTETLAKSDDTFTQTVKAHFRKVGTWKWAGIGAAIAAVLAGVFFFTNKKAADSAEA